MLELHLSEVDIWDEKIEVFYTIRAQTLKLEHSLVSLAKWESKWEKPFLSEKKMSFPETVHYIQCMTITQNVDPYIYAYLARFHLDEIYKYMELSMTATTFSKNKEPWRARKIVTAEVIYYWMTELNVPIECQKWHLNRLITLINVCNLERQPKKNMSIKELHKRNHALNQQRLKQLGTKG